MRDSIFLILLILAALFISACDADLFKTEDEPEPPTVSEIESNVANFILDVGDTAKFWITASDPDGKALTYNWEKTGGEFVTTFDGPEVTWRAPLKGGDDTISVQVSNEDKQVTKSRIVRIISSEKPVVRIINPAQDEYLVQYQNFTLEVEAFHDNGISVVKFYVNDQFVGNFNERTANIYDYHWYVDAPAGESQIKVLAEARSVGTLNEVSTRIKIEGVIPGKR